MAVDELVPTSHPTTWRDYLKQHAGDVFLNLDEMGNFARATFETPEQIVANYAEWMETQAEIEQRLDTSVEPPTLFFAERVYGVTAGDYDYLQFCRCHQHIEEDMYFFNCEEESES